MSQTKHYFNLPLGSSYEMTEDGGLIVRNTVAMGPGEWISMQGVRTVFSEDVLQRCAEKWVSNGVWTRHPGGSPRNTNEKVGVVQNPRYESGRGVVVDMYLHGKTGFSKDLIGQVQLPKELGGTKDVSAETMLDINPNGNVLDITFTGLAIVDIGACETCKMPAYAAGDGGTNMAEGEDPSASGGGTENADTLVSVARDLFRELGYSDIADLLDLAVSLDGDEAAIKEIVSKLKSRGKADESSDAPMTEVLEPFGKKLDDIMAYMKKIGDGNEAFAKKLGSIEMDIQSFSKRAVPQTKGPGYMEVVSYEENAPAVRRK